MACFQPLLAVDFGVVGESQKHSVKILPTQGKSLQDYRLKYGDSLMFLPCNKCVGCAQDYARAWQCRIMCEYESRREQGEEKASFITLTYSVEPSTAELSVANLRQFIKDIRNAFGKGIKFFACTERGSLTKRLHHHAILFGVDFSEDREVISKRGLNFVYKSNLLSSIWKHGFSSIGSLDISSAGYVSKYCDKKKISRTDDGESVIMSRGLGKDYFKKHKNEIFESDYLYFDGNRFKIPRTFLRWALDDDFYYQVMAQDYQDRKRLVAQSFRYDKNKSFRDEEHALLDTKEMLEIKKAHEEVIRDVS